MYSKLGQGSLDLYILSPVANTADFKEFVVQQQHRFSKSMSHQKSPLAVQQYFRQVPMSHMCSSVCLVVWMPAGVGSSAVRLLFPGNAPQNVLFAALDKVKDFDVLSTPIYKCEGEYLNIIF